jgi:hypothetical protein
MAEIRIAMISAGKAYKASSTSDVTRSIFPPKNPDRAPTIDPVPREIITELNATRRENVVPKHTRLKMSLPMSSVPII